jgi:hypothetical protein
MSNITDERLRQLLRAGTRDAADPDNPTPPISKALMDWLEGIYPAKCYEPSKETVEEHLLYAGCVKLVQNLRHIREAQSTPDEAASLEDHYPLEAPTDWDEAERAGGEN